MDQTIRDFVSVLIHHKIFLREKKAYARKLQVIAVSKLRVQKMLVSQISRFYLKNKDVIGNTLVLSPFVITVACNTKAVAICIGKPSH